MHPSNPYNSYKNISAQTAPPGKIILMMFDGTLRFLEQAKQGFDLTDPLDRNLAINNNLQRSRDIITELDRSVNTDKCGELAYTLKCIYHYCDKRISEANRDKDITGINDVSRQIYGLRDAWAEMLTNQTTINVDHPSLSFFENAPRSLAEIAV